MNKNECIDYGGIGKRYFGARKDWEKLYGPIPDGLFLLHSCDNPRCKNPDHWFLGSQSDNIKDMFSKGRGVNNKGIEISHRHREILAETRRNDVCPHAAILTKEQVLAIRDSPNKSTWDWVVEFKVSYSVIKQVQTRKTWRNV